VITYQEQVMRIANVLAGFSLAEADVLRKAVGKKDKELIQQELGRFVERAVALGHERRGIEDIAAQIETFGRYGFNKSHAVAYSVAVLSDRVAQGALCARVPVGPVVVRDRQHGQRRALHQRGARARPRGAAGRMSTSPGSSSRWSATAGFASGSARSRTSARARSSPSSPGGRRAGRTAPSSTCATGSTCGLCNKRVLEALIDAGACDSLGAIAPSS